MVPELLLGFDWSCFWVLIVGHRFMVAKLVVGFWFSSIGLHF